MPKGQLVHKFEIPNAYPVELRQTSKNRFVVVYGQQVTDGLSDEQAMDQLGQDLFHALRCAHLMEPVDRR